MCGYCVEQAMIDVWEQESATGKPVSEDRLFAILLPLHVQESNLASNITLHSMNCPFAGERKLKI